MKQVVQNYRSGELKVDDVPMPVVLPGGLLVETHYSLISGGTERSTVKVAKKNLIGKAMERPDMLKKVIQQVKKNGLSDTLRMVFDRLDNPAALGYSCAGTVLEVGEHVEGFNVGDKVACAGQNYASHAEIVSVPKNLCIKIPDGVSFNDAAYVAVGSIALQGVRQAAPQLGETVAVIGLGLLGQLTAQMLKANGCRVIATDLDESKNALAQSLGADHAVGSGQFASLCHSLTQSQGVDAVIITASTKSNAPVALAGEICRKRGRVIVVGAVGMDLPREDYYVKEIDFRLSTSYGPGRYDSRYEEEGIDYPYAYVRWTEQRNMQAFLELIADQRIKLDEITTHTFVIGESQSAYDMISDNRSSYLGILLDYTNEDVEKDKTVDIVEQKAVNTLNFGLIGVGNHVKDRLLPELKKISDVSLHAICTQTGVKAKALAEKLQTAYCTSDYHEITSDEIVNTILIGTRHDTHAAIVLDAIRQEKHIFVEKPLCLTEQELDDIETEYKQALQKNSLVLMVGFNRRYSTHTQKIKQVFANKRNPLMMSYRVNAGAIPADHWIQNMAIGGGRIIGEACHFIDYMAYVANAVPVSIHANAISHHESNITQDHSVISIRFSDGSVGTLIYAAGGDLALPKERFEVFGDGVSIIMDDFVKTEFYQKGKKETYKSDKQDKGFAEQMQTFCRKILSGNDSSSDGQGSSDNQHAEEFEYIKSVTKASILAVKSMQTQLVYPVQ